MTSPETGEVPSQPEAVQGAIERQEEVPIPEKIQDIGVKATRSQITAQVNDDDDDDNKPLMQTPARKVTVTLPANQDTIEDWTKGDTRDSSTWLGYFWVRLIKKALHFGWKVVVGGKEGGQDK